MRLILHLIGFGFTCIQAFQIPTNIIHSNPCRFVSSSVCFSNSKGDDDEILTPPDFNYDLLSEQDELCKEATHLIAIPLEENKEFMIELESVQRAALYNCPMLVHSVIAPSSTKLPLLLVNTKTSPEVSGYSAKSGLPGFDATKSMVQRMEEDKITNEINAIVNDVVQDLIYSKKGRQMVSKYNEIGDDDNDDEYIPEPVMLSFQGLEIEGSLVDPTIEHEVLMVLGKENKVDMDLMRYMVNEIRMRIEERGWSAGFIPYRPQSAERPELDDLDMSDLGEDKWRARVPFMRLPRNFEELLPPVKEGLFGTDMRSPDEGGDGISPLFWFDWRKDEFTPKKYGTRCREIAVYSRTAPSPTYDEYSFYIPRACTLLPGTTSSAVSKVEKDSKAYDDKRQEQSRKADEEAWDSSNEEYFKTRNSLFSDEDQNENADDDDGNDETESQIKRTKPFKPPFQPPTPTQRTGGAPTEKKPIERSVANSNDNTVDLDAARRKISKMMEKRNMEVKKIPQSMPVTKPQLPTYPSDQYFIGFWRMVTSPLPQSSLNPEVDIVDCDNLVLRVDGSISGGPIFDPKLQLRAAGGSWRMFQAKYVGDKERKDAIQTRLRIELIVPPRKDKLLVMEGKVSRISMGADGTTPGISSIGNDGSAEIILSCSGESYLQDIEGVRRKTGLFSIRKIATPEEVDFSFPVAPPSGLQ